MHAGQRGDVMVHDRQRRDIDELLPRRGLDLAGIDLDRDAAFDNFLSDRHTYIDYQGTRTCIVSGISSHSRPRYFRPFADLERFSPSAPHVPHCLKKNAVPAASHWRFMLSTHSGFIGRAFRPDSPPTITQ